MTLLQVSYENTSQDQRQPPLIIQVFLELIFLLVSKVKNLSKTDCADYHPSSMVSLGEKRISHPWESRFII